MPSHSLDRVHRWQSTLLERPTSMRLLPLVCLIFVFLFHKCKWMILRRLPYAINFFRRFCCCCCCCVDAVWSAHTMQFFQWFIQKKTRQNNNGMLHLCAVQKYNICVVRLPNRDRQNTHIFIQKDSRANTTRVQEKQRQEPSESGEQKNHISLFKYWGHQITAQTAYHQCTPY